MQTQQSVDSLPDYVKNHTKIHENGSVDVYEFRIDAVNNPDISTFLRLTKEHKGQFNEVDPFDGEGHTYIELAGWIGGEQTALEYMALGHIFGFWNVVQPKMFVDITNEDGKRQADEMARSGMIAMIPRKTIILT